MSESRAHKTLTARELIQKLLEIDNLDLPVSFPDMEKLEEAEDPKETVEISTDPTTYGVVDIEEGDGEIILKPYAD